MNCSYNVIVTKCSVKLVLMRQLLELLVGLASTKPHLAILSGSVILLYSIESVSEIGNIWLVVFTSLSRILPGLKK